MPHRLQLCSHPAETLGDGSQPPDGGQRVQGLVGFGGIDVNPEPAQGQPAPHRFPRHLPSVVLSAGITGALVAPFHPCCCASPRPGVFPTPAPTHLRLPAEGLFALPHEKAAALLSGSESSPAMAACPGRNRSRQTPSEPRDVPGCPSRPPDATAGAGGSQGPPTTSAGGARVSSHPTAVVPGTSPKSALSHSLASTTKLRYFDLFREICLDISALPASQPQQRELG